MGRDLRSLRIDREQAIKLAAMIGLGLVGLSVLPGMLKPPEQPPVPPDVGFRPAELGRIAEIPSRPPVRRKAEEAADRREHHRTAANRESRSRQSARKQARGRDRSRQHGPDSETAGDISGAGIPSSPLLPEPSPPPVPTPVPPPAVEPHPADGSQEFAPR